MRQGHTKNIVTQYVYHKLSSLLETIKKYTLIDRILILSLCLSLFTSGVYSLYHRYVRYLLINNRYIYYALSHIDLQNWNIGAGLFIFGLGGIVIYFYVVRIFYIVENDYANRNKAYNRKDYAKIFTKKEINYALIIYIIISFIQFINLMFLPILLTTKLYRENQTLILVVVTYSLFWTWYTIILFFHIIMEWIKNDDGKNIPRIVVVVGLLGTILGILLK